MTGRQRFGAMFLSLTFLAAACGSGGDGTKAAEKPSKKADKAAEVDTEKVTTATKTIGLKLDPAEVLHPEGALNPTTAVDLESGSVYAAWGRELPVAEGSDEDPLIEAVVARSDDGGATFSEPVVVSPAGDRVVSYTVSPTQVEVGADGTVYVLYLKNVEAELPGHAYGFSYLQLVRSDDGGKTFSAPVDAAPEVTEGVTSREMATLFLAPDGDLHISFLDFRERIQIGLDKQAGKIPLEDKPHSGHGAAQPEPLTQLRMVRSSDGGATFSPSVLVSKPTCACCGTKVAEGEATPLFATTRSDWKELKGSKDAVRDPFLSVSDDDGETWSDPTKIHDDRFKISGCPDVNAGLQVDSKDRLHAAWYTGTDRGPGVYYAVSKDDGKTFSKPRALMQDEWVPYGDVQMVIDEKDRAWVAYEDRRGEVDKVQVVRIDPDGTLTYSKGWPGTAPDIAANAGEAYVVWANQASEDEKSGPVKFAVVKVIETDEEAAAR